MYKLKHGYLIGSDFKDIVNEVKKDIDIQWCRSMNINKISDNEYWSSNARLLKSDYIIVDLSNVNETNSYELGIVWTINYVRKLLSRSGHKDAIKQLDKFGICEKSIIGISKNKDKSYLLIALKDQGKIFKSQKEVITYIKNKEK
ncbi:MAG: hypothetical protein LBT17_03405 [Mycoplasmataceae bacterium]|nr:hypothetical protein [Mycoplasmataceae bacterium]